jgi:multiple sugar transport system substrate-binding protein
VRSDMAYPPGRRRGAAIGRRRALGAVLALALAAAGCRRADAGPPAVTFSGSALGAEGALLKRQIVRYVATHPGAHVEIQPTPDDANQRHQLYVQWLNARVGNPDVLQLDVIWTPEFAAAGWILPLDRFSPPRDSFFPATVRANVWADRLYALPWFADVGLLYRRTDLAPTAPATVEELVAAAKKGVAHRAGPRYGIVWQGARYEGLVTGFLEYLGAYGGQIMTDDGRVVVDSPEAVRALTFMRDQIYTLGVAPQEVLTWHEEEARFAFQNGNAVFMRNWPYAYATMQSDRESRVAGRFTASTMPAAPGGHPTAALGGGQLAINAFSDRPREAYALIAYLTAPDQMLERAAVVGQYPTRPALYDDPRLASALPLPVGEARRAIESATPRPVIPIYSQLSELLQIQLHRALVRQATPEEALRTAASQMRTLVDRTKIRELMTAEREGSGSRVEGRER